MKKLFTIYLLSLLFLLSACVSDEPLGIECDIEAIELKVSDYATLFNFESDLSQRMDDITSKVITFTAKSDAKVGSYDTYLTITQGSRASWLDAPADSSKEFLQVNPTTVHRWIDYADEQIHTFRVESEDGQWKRDYTVQIAHLPAEDTISTSTSSKVFTYLYEFNEGSYHLFGKNPNKNNYYVWEETVDSLKALFKMGDYTWKNGNPGFKIANSSLSPMEYPTVPVVGGGPDGSDCLKLETKSAGKMGEDVGCPTAAGSMFLGTFSAEKALASKDEAVKSTLFGNPFTHIPTMLEADIKLVNVGTAYLADGTPFTDEPDIYCVFYDNAGGTFVLDGGNVLTDREHIKAIARLPHLYDGILDKVTVNPIHGLVPGGGWQHVSLPMDYHPFDKSSIDSTTETRLQTIDLEKLKRRGYSIALGASSSWQGGEFHAFVGNSILLDNIKLTCVDPASSSADAGDDDGNEDNPGGTGGGDNPGGTGGGDTPGGETTDTIPETPQKDSQCELTSITIGNASSLFEKAEDAVQQATSATTYTFNVKWNADLTSVPVTFKYSEKASMYYEDKRFVNGTAVNFNSGQQSFTLVSEDEAHRKTFTLRFERLPKPTYSLKMDFNAGFALNSTSKYYEWTETDATLKKYLFGTVERWGTSNLGYSIFRNGQEARDYPVVPSQGGHEGNCVLLRTLSNSTMGVMTNKRFTPGMLFLGNEGNVTSPQEVSAQNMKMGVPFKAKPLRVSAYLKYTPGTNYQDASGNPQSGMTDEPDFFVVVYKNTGGSLTFADALTNQHIVGVGRLGHPIHGVGTSWTKVTLDITYKDGSLKASDFASGNYSLAICASSSYDALHYCGALDSKLYVDDIVLEYETE